MSWLNNLFGGNQEKGIAAQRYREWAEVPPGESVHYSEITVQGDTPEQAKAYMEEQCRQAYAGEPVDWSVEIIDGNVQVFIHERK